MKRFICFPLSLIMICSMLLSAGAFASAEPATFPVTENKEFGGAIVKASQEEFSVLGAELGDSLDVQFSTGFTLEDIPYYDGYYERVNHPAVVNYPGLYIDIAYCSGDSIWKCAGCKEDDTVTITIREKGKYLNQQKTMASTYTDDRADYASEEVFANYRVMVGGNLTADMFYRGASPVDNIHKRAATVDSLIKKSGVHYVLDLADNEKKIASYMKKEDFVSDYAASLYKEGNIGLLALTAAYRSDAFKSSLADGLREMMKHDGPYYIHCTEGKDRTGFVCILLEALADASYEEIEADYMKTYDNYYGITEETNPEKYSALRELRLYDMLWWLADLPDNTDLSGMHFKEAAEKYLRTGGMTDEVIKSLEAFLNA